MAVVKGYTFCGEIYLCVYRGRESRINKFTR